MSFDTQIELQDELKITACAFYDDIPVGFALPLLSLPHSTSAYAIQIIDEYSGKVSAFKPLEYQLSAATPLPTALTSRIGGDVMYVFVDTNLTFSCGSLQTIEPALRLFANEHPNQIPILLQIFELIGSLEERRTIRIAMRTKIRDDLGETAARAFYEQSTLRMAVWNRLIKAAPDAAAATRIIEARSRIEPKVDSAGQITIDLSAVNPADYSNLAISSLIDELHYEFDFNREPSEHSSNLNYEWNPSNALGRIASHGRLEERIATLLDELIRAPDVGREAILKHYDRDKAVVATRMLKNVIIPAFSQRSDQVEFLVAKLIPKLYTQEFPMQRGVFLYFLAKHLGKYRHINAAIRARTQKSRAFSVQNYRQDIEECLNVAQVQRDA